MALMMWILSAFHTSLSSLPSLCQKFYRWWKFAKVLTKIILHSFFGTRYRIGKWRTKKEQRLENAGRQNEGSKFKMPWVIFTVRRSALHGLCDRNSVCPSVRLSVCHTRGLVAVGIFQYDSSG